MYNVSSINAFFNLVYDNEKALVRALKDKDTLESLINLLKVREIENTYIHAIDLNAQFLLSNAKTMDEVDAVLHIPVSDEVKTLQQQFNPHTHIVIMGIDEELNIEPSYKEVYFYQVEVSKESNTVYDPFIHSVKGFANMDNLPGLLIFNQNQCVFKHIDDASGIEEIKKEIDKNKDLFNENDKDDSYFIHISDLHIGKEANNQGLDSLMESLDMYLPMLESNYPTKFVITGDLMESPKVNNMVKARNFMNKLKKKYQADITFVLGNHDVIVHGLNLNRTQKSKVIANLLAESIKVIEEEKLILIKMDTNIEGNLARGKVGQRQFDEIDEELDAIKNIQDYTIIVLMHHHLYAIEKSEFVKKKWHEDIKLLDKWVDNSKALIDADKLRLWLKKHNIHYVFHGHKHVPAFRSEDEQFYIGAGKATGGLKERNSRYISYNIVKYSHRDQHMKICIILYYDKKEDNRLRIEYYRFGGNHELNEYDER